MHERKETDDLLLLACDGLWDVMTTAEAVAQVRELFESGERSVAKIAEEMLDVSLKKGEERELLCHLPDVVGVFNNRFVALVFFPKTRLEGQHQRAAGQATRRRAGPRDQRRRGQAAP